MRTYDRNGVRPTGKGNPQPLDSRTKVFTGASGTNVIRLLPPLCLSKAEADEFLVRLRKVLG